MCVSLATARSSFPSRLKVPAVELLKIYLCVDFRICDNGSPVTVCSLHASPRQPGNKHGRLARLDPMASPSRPPGNLTGEYLALI